MASAILRGTVDLVVSSASESNKQLSFDNDETLHIYIQDISEVPNTDTAQEHPKACGSVLLGETSINLSRNHEFPLEFQCEYDPGKISNSQFDKLCNEGLIVVGAEVDAEGREMTKFWLKSGPKKFEQNIKLTMTDAYQ
jgi:hypothetical protein